ncbi:MAG: hypothetical protein ABSC23_03250 [Bryobacteraceae bacterium]|jgi:hypothetical protein
MKSYRLFSISLAIAATLAAPVWAQLGGGGGLVGGVAGGVTGAGQGAVGGSVSGAAHGAASVTEPAAGQRGPMGGPNGSLRSAASVADNAALSAHMQTLLPRGETVSHAAAGFEFQDQFTTAVHAAHNLNIPFGELKASMTGSGHASLDKAIRNLRPDLDGKDVKDNVKLAERESAYDAVGASSSGKPDRMAARIASDSNLSARLNPMLPPDLTMTQAAAGFKNQGQFIAALQASKNTGVPFADLKDRMTAGQSLGAAIQGMKPGMSAGAAAQSAQTAEAQSKALQTGASASANMNATASAKAR